MDISWKDLRPETLRAVIEEFVTRDGTDYGEREAGFEAKVEEVLELLKEGKVRVVFDSESESCDIRETLR